MSLLEVKNLRKTYAKRTVVKGVSFTVEEGEIVCLLGPNGAGKTTTFSMTIGLIPRDDGQVLFRGLDVGGLPMYQRARRGMGYLSQQPSVFLRMTTANNILSILETLRLSRAERRKRCDELLTRLGLTHVSKSMAFMLSGGERRRLEIARALVTSPRLILLDEPFSNIDPKAVAEIQRLILELRNGGIGILITDHYIERALSIADRSFIIFEGLIEASGSAADLLSNDRARDLYLGHDLQLDHLVRPKLEMPSG